MNPTLTPAHYSYSWAMSVVHKAKNAHARVAELWMDFHGLTDRQLAKLIAEGRPEWPELRRALQIFDNWLSHSRLHLLDRNWLQVMITGRPVLFCTPLLDYLRDRNLHATIDEQGSGEGDRRSVSDGEPLPSDFFFDGMGV